MIWAFFKPPISHHFGFDRNLLICCTHSNVVFLEVIKCNYDVVKRDLENHVMAIARYQMVAPFSFVAMQSCYTSHNWIMNFWLEQKDHCGPPHCVGVCVKCQEKQGELPFSSSTFNVTRAQGGEKGGYNGLYAIQGALLFVTWETFLCFPCIFSLHPHLLWQCRWCFHACSGDLCVCCSSLHVFLAQRSCILFFCSVTLCVSIHGLVLCVCVVVFHMGSLHFRGSSFSSFVGN